MRIRKFYTLLQGPISGGLPKLLLGVPNFRGAKARFLFNDFRAWNASLRSAPKRLVQVKRLDRIVRTNTVTRGFCAKASRILGLVLSVASLGVCRLHERIVILFGNDIIFRRHFALF